MAKWLRLRKCFNLTEVALLIILMLLTRTRSSKSANKTNKQDIKSEGKE